MEHLLQLLTTPQIKDPQVVLQLSDMEGESLPHGETRALAGWVVGLMMVMEVV
jgi:hypothetical protein